MLGDRGVEEFDGGDDDGSYGADWEDGGDGCDDGEDEGYDDSEEGGCGSRPLS